MAYGTFVNPGYLASKEVEGILDKRREEARQAMLDELERQRFAEQMKDHAANRDIQREQMEANREWRLGQAAERTELANDRKLKNSGLSMGDEVLDDTDPDLLRVLKERRLLRPEAPPPPSPPLQMTGMPGVSEPSVVDTNTPPSLMPAPKQVYAGLPEERQEATRQKAIDVLMSSKEFNEADAIHKTLMAERIGAKLPPGVLDNKKMVPMPTFDENTKKWFTAPGAPPAEEGKYNTVGRAPQGPTESWSVIGPTDDKKGILYGSNRGNTKVVPIPEGNQFNPRPTAGRAANGRPFHPQLDAGEEKTLAEYKKKATPIETPGWFGRTTTTPPESANVIAYKSYLSSLPMGLTQNPDLAVATSQIILRADDKMSNEQAVDAILPTIYDATQITPEERAEVLRILNMIRK
jgi:hypothetical protein